MMELGRTGQHRTGYHSNAIIITTTSNQQPEQKMQGVWMSGSVSFRYNMSRHIQIQKGAAVGRQTSYLHQAFKFELVSKGARYFE
jgi:hypothetical protein